MDMQSFGRELVEVLAQRSLEALRTTRLDAVRDVVSGRALHPTSRAATAGMTIGALLVGAAIGAGVTALLTPTSGPDLQKRIARSTRGARRRAAELGETITHGVEDAGEAIMHSVESASTAIGLASPASSSSKKRLANGQSHGTSSHGKRARAHA